MGDRVMNSRALPSQADGGDALLSAMINRLIEAYDPERAWKTLSPASGGFARPTLWRSSASAVST